MNGGKRPFGYTIVEVMIVLAVSGAMFAIAAVFINGKQANNAFRAGVNEFASQMQAVIDQVNDGQYSDINFNCATSGSALSLSSGSTTQGTNDKCVFLGKIVQLGVNGKPGDYEVFSMAGQRSLGGKAVTSYTDAWPTPIANGAIDLTRAYTIPQALEVAKVTIYPAAGGSLTTVGAFGVLQSLGSASSTYVGGYASGGQSLVIEYAPLVSTSDTKPGAVSNLTSTSGALKLSPANGVKICLSDSAVGGVKFGEVSIGSDAYSQLNVKTNLGVSACS